jgi:opacity protein-like surface antigen
MLRVIVLSTTAAFVAFLFFAISAQADEIEPEPEPAPIAEPAPEAEPEPKPEPVPEPVRTQDDGFARNGIYVGINMAGASYQDVKDDIKPFLEALRPEPFHIRAAWSDAHVEVKSPLGFGARAGYRFHPHFAGELQFHWFSKAAVELDDGTKSTEAVKFKTMALTGNLKGYLFTGRIQPFLLAGAGIMNFDLQDKLNLGLKRSGEGFAVRLGGGIDLYLNENIVLEIEGGRMLPFGEISGMDHIFWSVGLKYRF